MSQREYDALMQLRMEAERLYDRLSIEQMEYLARNMQVVEAVAEGRIDVLEQFVPVRMPEPGVEDPTFPRNAEIRLRRYPVTIDAAVPWAERIPKGLECQSANIFMTLRAFIASSKETLRLFRFDGTYATLEQADTALAAARCRPATTHHLVAFAAAYKVGAHAFPGRILATGSMETLPATDGGALLVPHILYDYDIDAEYITKQSLELKKIFSMSSSGIAHTDYLLGVEDP